MDAMGANVAFLPLGGCGNNWTDSLPLRQQIVWRLHEIGEMAKARRQGDRNRHPLDAEGNIKLLDEINSEGIKIFYKFQTAIENKRNIAKEIEKTRQKTASVPYTQATRTVCGPETTRL